MNLFVPYSTFCLILLAAASSVERSTKRVSLRRQHPPIHHRTCRYVCTDEGSNDTQKRHDVPGPGDPGLLIGNDLVGIVFNSAGGFGGLVRRFSNLRDVLQGFPRSAGVIITRLENLRLNPFLQRLLQVNQSDIGQAANWSRIYSTPVGLIFNPSNATTGNENSPDFLLEIRALLRRIPILGGIFLRLSDVLGQNGSTALFYGPERGYQIATAVFEDIFSQLHLNRNETPASLIRFLPILSAIAEDLSRNNATNVGGRFVEFLLSFRRLLDNPSILQEINSGTFRFYQLPEVINARILYYLTLGEKLYLSYIERSDLALNLHGLFERLSHDLTGVGKELDSGNGAARALRPFLDIAVYFLEALGGENATLPELGSGGTVSIFNILHSIEEAISSRGQGDLIVTEIAERIAYQLSYLGLIIRSEPGIILRNPRLRPFVAILPHLEEALADGNLTSLTRNEFRDRFVVGITDLYNFIDSENNPLRFLSRPFLAVLDIFSNSLGNAIGEESSGCDSESGQDGHQKPSNSTEAQQGRKGGATGNKGKHKQSSKDKTSPHEKNRAKGASTGKGHSVKSKGKSADNKNGNFKSTAKKGGSEGKSAQQPTQSRFNPNGKPYVSNTKTSSHGSGNRLQGTGRNGNGGVGAKEKDAKRISQKNNDKSSAKKNAKNKENRGTAKKSIDEKYGGAPYHKIKPYEEPTAATRQPVSNIKANSVQGTGGNGSGGSGSGSIGIGGPGVNEKTLKQPSHDRQSHGNPEARSDSIERETSGRNGKSAKA